MNLALIDPFQLAQDYPDALTNDLREPAGFQSPNKVTDSEARLRARYDAPIQSQGRLSCVGPRRWQGHHLGGWPGRADQSQTDEF